MRIALLADIHANTLALDAVLADIEERRGVDGYWILGDIAANGFDPSGVIDRLRALPNAVFIRGNGDRQLATHQNPPPTIEDAAANPALLPQVMEIAGNFAWTRGHLAARGHFGWLQTLPLEQRLTLPDGTRVLLVHAEPGEDDGQGLNPGLSDDQVRASLARCNADFICVGHFHVPIDRTLNGWRIVNPGSVGFPFRPDLRPGYAILTATETEHDFAFYRVEYDRQAAIDAIRRCGNPAEDFLIWFLNGDFRASWLDHWDGVTYSPTVVAEAG